MNEHNRIMIPTIFISESQLGTEEVNWLQGVRTRESKGIDLLEGKKPNLGWLGPEMSGEEGATFKEKLWWAIDEGKVRLGGGQTAVDSLGKLYDFELPLVDEQSNLQVRNSAQFCAQFCAILPQFCASSLPPPSLRYYSSSCSRRWRRTRRTSCRGTSGSTARSSSCRT